MPDEPVAARGKPAKGEKPVGKVEHYYPKAKAAAVGLTGDLKVGDDIHIVGHGDDVRTKVKTLQLDHAPIAAGHAGQHIGVGLAKKVHEGDDVLIVNGQASKADSAPKKAAAKPRKATKAARKTKKAKAKRAKAKRSKARKPKRAKATRRKPSKAKRGKKAARRKPKKAARKAKRGKARRR